MGYILNAGIRKALSEQITVFAVGSIAPTPLQCSAADSAAMCNAFACVVRVVVDNVVAVVVDRVVRVVVDKVVRVVVDTVVCEVAVNVEDNVLVRLVKLVVVKLLKLVVVKLVVVKLVLVVVVSVLLVVSEVVVCEVEVFVICAANHIFVNPNGSHRLRDTSQTTKCKHHTKRRSLRVTVRHRAYRLYCMTCFVQHINANEALFWSLLSPLAAFKLTAVGFSGIVLNNSAKMRWCW